ncbi:Nitrogen assimilation transcription factor nit-4 [Beauveria bassiana]|nr:Nitrogen assimilation transcription factor nit-4 [Beauveria bassiana]
MEHNYRALQPRDGAPQRPAPLYPVVTKRHAASVACQECRLKRIKVCEGRRPICSNCAKRGVDCAYRDELCVSKDARETVVKVVHMLGRMPSSDAIRIIDSTRNEPSAEKILALIRDGLARQNKQRTPVPPGCSNPTTPGVQDEHHGRPEALETRHSVATTTHSSTSDPPLPSPRTAHQPPGGTLLSPNLHVSSSSSSPPPPPPNQLESSSSTWSCVTDNVVLTHHLLALYFCWEYPSFAPLSKEHFLHDFSHRRHRYCSPMLVNALLALGCHLSERPNLHGDAFFAESQRLFLASAPPGRGHQFLPTIQALVIMSIREARCGRAVQSQHYAKLAIRLAIEMGLHIVAVERDDEERVVLLKTFWGAFTLHQ